MLECKEISRRYGNQTVVDKVSLQFAPGQIHALLGPNGSGKTTLMKMAAGLVKPSEGGFYYQDKPVGVESRREIVYLSTEPYFYPWMTAADVGTYYRDFFEDFCPERYQVLLERMELSPKMKTKSLSSGMMAKLKVAAALSRDAKVFLLDEPFNGIDLLARDEITACILEASGPETALVISSHLVEELEKIIDTAVFLKDGKTAAVCNAESLREEQNQSVAGLYREIYGHGGEVC